MDQMKLSEYSLLPTLADGRKKFSVLLLFFTFLCIRSKIMEKLNSKPPSILERHNRQLLGFKYFLTADRIKIKCICLPCT